MIVKNNISKLKRTYCKIILVFLGCAVNEEDLLYYIQYIPGRVPPVYSQFPCLEKQTPSPGRQTGWSRAPIQESNRKLARRE